MSIEMDGKNIESKLVVSIVITCIVCYSVIKKRKNVFEPYCVSDTEEF